MTSKKSFFLPSLGVVQSNASIKNKTDWRVSICREAYSYHDLIAMQGLA
jgi:hypothetical protein